MNYSRIAAAFLLFCLAAVALADFDAGFNAYSSSDYTSALRLLKPEAEAGNKIAQNLMGVMNAQGKGTVQNDAEAVKWYRMAADLGYAVAQTNLGFMYEQGRGVDRDLSQAREWYTKASNQGDQRAKFSLILLRQAEETKRSFERIQQSSIEVARNEATFFMELIKASNNKSFCVPPKTTMGQAAAALAEYGKSHPSIGSTLTESQMIAALAAIYPCFRRSSDVSTLVGNTVSVAPQGSFATIDTSTAMRVMKTLKEGTTADQEQVIADILAHSDRYPPPVFFALAEALWKLGKRDDAFFWFNAGRMRGTFDALICTDQTARQGVSVMVMSMPQDMRKAQFDDLDKLKSIILKVVKWDEGTPYNYDHRWINLHGIGAMNSSLGGGKEPAALSLPQSEWPAIATKVRDDYLASLDKAIITVRQTRTDVKPGSP